MTPAPLSGILVIDKHAGPTSMQVCANIRARLRRAGEPGRVKVGHAGTLDPLATGVLIVLVGRATRLCERLMRDEKEYEAGIDLSRRSTTDDTEGEITEITVTTPPSRTEVERACAALVGRIQQAPPVYSAVHVKGRRAYRLAREGRPPTIPPRPVEVRAFEVLEYSWPLLKARITCAKGVYVRSLARDLGVLLGTGGMLASLCRTRVGAFGLSQARRLADLPEALTRSDLLPPPDL
jgi:tRNA pseudouridine55 synthase